MSLSLRMRLSISVSVMSETVGEKETDPQGKELSVGAELGTRTR